MSKPIVYAIGDIHGQYMALKNLYHKIIAHVESREDDRERIFVCLGDYIDRGPGSFEVIDFLRSDPFPGHTVFLKGNHEDMWIDAMNGINYDLWYRNGGMATDNSYGGAPPPEEHMDWLRKLQVKYVIEHYLFVHAGVNPAKPFNEQTDAELMWIRDKFLSATEPFGFRVVHGHTPVLYDPLNPVMFEDHDGMDKPLILFPNTLTEDDARPTILPNRINLDTGAGYGGGMLSCGVIDTETDEVEVLAVSVKKTSMKITDKRIERDQDV